MLQVEVFNPGFGVKDMKVTGFSEDELEVLHKNRGEALTDLVLKLLDEHNDRLGTRWFRGYGVYGVRFQLSHPDVVIVTIGTSCG